MDVRVGGGAKYAVRLFDRERDAGDLPSSLAKKDDPQKDPNVTGDPYKALFVSRSNYETTEHRIKREFEAYGPIKWIGSFIKFARKMIPDLFRRKIPLMEIENDAARKKTLHSVGKQQILPSATEYIIFQDGEQIMKSSSCRNSFADVGPAQAELYALCVLSRDLPDFLNVECTRVLIDNHDNYLLMKGFRDQKSDVNSVLNFKMRASIHRRLKKKLTGRVDYFFITGRSNRADKEAKMKQKQVYNLKADELEAKNQMILHFLGNEGPKTSDPSTYKRYIHNRVILENATIRACAVSTLAKLGALVDSFKPRIFVLDDEVDPSTGEAEDDGVEDEYQLEDFEDVAADYVLKVGVHNFKNAWDSMGPEDELVDEYGLSTRESLAEDVNVVTNILDMQPCEVAMTHPLAVTNCNIDMESLISDQNRIISTLTIFTLLKTGNESSVDRLMKQITNFMSDIAYEFKIVVVETIRSLFLNFPLKYQSMINILSNILREGWFEYKNAIVDSIIILIREIPDAKESSLFHLCEFVEDEFTYLLTQVDPSTGEAEDDGVEDEYQLEDFEGVAADYVLKVGVHNFKIAWDSMGPEDECVDEHGLGTRESLAEAVNAVINILGIQPCEVAMTHPLAVTNCNIDMESLISDQNRIIATLTITTLLKTGNESSVDCLMKQITNFMSDIAYEFKIIVVETIRSLFLNFPLKYQSMINIYSNILREEGGFEYKKATVDSIVILMREIPDAKESGLFHHCEFVEDCEFTYLSTQVDPSTGEAEDAGVEDEYQQEDFEVVAANYVLKVGLYNFKNAWDSMGPEDEHVDEYGLSTRESLAEAVNAVINILSMQPCEGLDPLTMAAMFVNARCIGKKVNWEDCYIPKLCTDPQTLKARSEGPAGIIRHALFGYFSQRLGSNRILVVMQRIGRTHRPVEGVMIAHSGRSVVILFRFGEVAMSHTKTRMEEAWTIEEGAFNVPGLSLDCFIPPADIKCGSVSETCELP